MGVGLSTGVQEHRSGLSIQEHRKVQAFAWRGCLT